MRTMVDAEVDFEHIAKNVFGVELDAGEQRPAWFLSQPRRSPFVTLTPKADEPIFLAPITGR